MNIGELARRHNITPATIRHYEKLSLLDDTHVERMPNGYRRFTELASHRLRLIKLGQLAGFSLHEMASSIRQWEEGELTVSMKKAILTQQLQRVEEEIGQLEAMKTYLLQEIEKECKDPSTPPTHKERQTKTFRTDGSGHKSTGIRTRK